MTIMYYKTVYTTHPGTCDLNHVLHHKSGTPLNIRSALKLSKKASNLFVQMSWKEIKTLTLISRLHDFLQ